MQVYDRMTVIDGFYQNPDYVREVALKQNYLDCTQLSGTWPGIRADKMLQEIDSNITQEFFQRIGRTLVSGQARFESTIETTFQLCYESHGDSWVHYDVGEITHVGLIYLNPNPPKNSGTLIYDIKPGMMEELKNYHDKNGLAKLNRNDEKELYEKFFEVVLEVPNRYNRMVMYGPQMMHKSDTYFGNSYETGRLTQPFFGNIKIH